MRAKQPPSEKRRNTNKLNESKQDFEKLNLLFKHLSKTYIALFTVFGISASIYGFYHYSIYRSELNIGSFGIPLELTTVQMVGGGLLIIKSLSSGWLIFLLLIINILIAVLTLFNWKKINVDKIGIVIIVAILPIIPIFFALTLLKDGKEAAKKFKKSYSNTDLIIEPNDKNQFDTTKCVVFHFNGTYVVYSTDTTAAIARNLKPGSLVIKK